MIAAASIAQKLSDLEKETREKLHAEKFSLGTPWLLAGDWLIVGDVHLPTALYEWVELVSIIGRRFKIKNLLIAGDLINMDSFSAWPQVSNMPTWAQERDSTKAVLHHWLKTFKQIRLLTGNHDRRLIRYTLGVFDTADVLALLIANPDRVQMSPFGWCNLQSGGEMWRITHPRNYSKIRLRVADDIAQKYGCNVVSFHEHHLGLTFDRYGRYVTVNGGGLIDPAQTAYMILEDNTSPVNIPGFVAIMNGSPYLFGKAPMTDWRKYL